MNKRLFLAALSFNCLVQGMQSPVPLRPIIPAAVTQWFSSRIPTTLENLQDYCYETDTWQPHKADRSSWRVGVPHMEFYRRRYKGLEQKDVSWWKVAVITRDRVFVVQADTIPGTSESLTDCSSYDQVDPIEYHYTTQAKLAATLATAATVGLIALAHRQLTKRKKVMNQPFDELRMIQSTAPETTTPASLPAAQTQEPAQ